MSAYPEIEAILNGGGSRMTVRGRECAFVRFSALRGDIRMIMLGAFKVVGIDPWEAALFLLACDVADRGGPEVPRPSTDDLLPSCQAHLAELVFAVMRDEAWAREAAAVLADQLTTRGDRWGTWLAALLEERVWGGWWTHPMRASLRHEIAEALSRVVTWAREQERARLSAAMGLPVAVTLGHAPGGLARSGFGESPLFWEHVMTDRPGGREWLDVPGHYWNPPYEHRPDFIPHGGTIGPAIAVTNERDSDDGRADLVGVFVEVGPDRTAWVDMTGRGLADLAAVRAAQAAARSIDAFSRTVGESGSLDSFREALADVSNSIDAVSKQTADLGESLRAMVEDVERSADTGARRRGPVGDRLRRRLERGRKR